MPRILHLGTGNFHRAHLAVYTADAGDGWKITGVSLRSPAVIKAMTPRDFTYTLAIQSATGTDYRQIDVIDVILFAPADPGAVINAISDADLISLTITEKGYCLAPNGTLDLTHPDVASDLTGTNKTALALLTRGLARRTKPVAILSCDNLTANGDTLRRAVQDFAKATNLDLPEGLEFPNTMVDRITPATTDTLRTEVTQHTGINDLAPVATEPFSEWAIENFTAPRPAWDKAGAQFVPDVAPYEARKLRLLNGAHSMLAYAGTLAGHTFVHEAIADAQLHAMTRDLMSEAAETLPPEIETETYRAALLERFANPTLHHKLRQIAMDGSQKLPVRLFDTIKARTKPSPALWAAVDAWVALVIAEAQAGHPLDDPMATQLAKIASGPNPEETLLTHLGAPARDGAPASR